MTDSQDTIKETAQVLEGKVVVGPGATQAGDAAEDVEDAPPPTSGDNPVVVTVTRRTTITDTAGNVLREYVTVSLISVINVFTLHMIQRCCDAEHRHGDKQCTRR